MARDFSKNTSNYMSLGANTLNTAFSGSTVISFAAWINFDTASSGANDNRVLNMTLENNVTGMALVLDGSVASPPVVRLIARSVNSDTLQAVSGSTQLTAGTWYHVGGVADFANDEMRVYLNGVEDGSASVTFGATSYTPGTPTNLDTIGAGEGAPSDTAPQVDGRIAEVGAFALDLADQGFALLADGYSPIFYRPEVYWPLVGRYSPEIEICQGLNGTITGTIANADHCRIINPAGLFSHHTEAESGDLFFARVFIAVP